MDFMSVDWRELGNKFDHYIQVVEAGKVVKIAKQGKPIAVIIPASVPEEDRLTKHDRIPRGLPRGMNVILAQGVIRGTGSSLYPQRPFIMGLRSLSFCKLR